MTSLLTATVPVFLVVLLGSALAYRRVISGDTWAQSQKLNYFLFIPAMFLAVFSSSDFAGTPVVRVVIATGIALGLASAAVWAWRTRRGSGIDLGAQILEGSVRANVPYGMGIGFALGGQAGLALFLVAAATYLPTVVLAGGLFRQLAGRNDSDPEAEQQFALVSALRLLAQNPIVAGAAIGIVLNVLGIPLMSGLDAVVRAAGFAAIPIGLLCAGAALSLAAAQNALDAARGDVLVALAIKSLGLPLLAGGLAALLGLEGAGAVAVVLIAALPCVVPRFSVASRGAGSVLAGIATFSTLLSVVVVPVALWILS